MQRKSFCTHAMAIPTKQKQRNNVYKPTTMKKTLLLPACLAIALGAKAQVYPEVDENLYRGYQPTFQPDSRLMQHHSAAKKVKAKEASGTTLPDHVNNATALWFPPTFNQVGNSCGAASRIGYMLTYEWNAFHLSNASVLENQMPAHFQYPFSYDGLSKDQMAIYVGYPDGAHYGGTDVSSTYGAYETDANDAGWMQGYDNWYNAMLHRISGTANFTQSSHTKEGAEAIKWWLFNHNGDTTWPEVEDENGRHIVGGICGLGCGMGASATAPIGATEANNKLGVVGKAYLLHWNTSHVDHAVTLVGYDDRIEFDLDGNGIYGEENNQLGQNETGAWIVANSWGSGWGNNGIFYVPYPMAGGVSLEVTTNEGKTAYKDKAGGWWPEVYYLRQNYKPTRTMKVTMQYSKRSEISVVAGASQDTTATKPEKEFVFRYINYTGDGDGNGVDAETPLLGRWADRKMHEEPMEFGIDLTDLSQGLDLSRPVKYFLTINSKASASGTGKICAASIMEYLYDAMGTETPFRMKDVEIKNNGASTVISVVVGGEAINPPTNLTQNGSTLSWDKPQGTGYQPTTYIIYMNGKEIARTAETTYEVSGEGAFTVKALYTLAGTEHISVASNTVAAAQTAEMAYDNAAQAFTNGGFLIPNITKKSHDQLTLEFWIKPTTIKDWNQQIGGPWGSFLLHANSDGTMYFGWNTANRRLSNVVLRIRTWTHLALVIDKNTATLYANGKAQGSITSTSSSGFPAFNDGLLMGYSSNSDNALYGTIDEVRVWDVAKSAKEISGNYTRPIVSPATTKNLLAYLKMNTITEDGVKKLEDCAHGNHATFINSKHQATTVTTNATIRPMQNLSAAISSPAEALLGESTPMAVSGGVDAAQFLWTATNATPAQSHASEPSFVFNQAGEQTVTLTLTTLDGVSSEFSKKIMVTEQVATADFEITNAQPRCGERTSFLPLNMAPGCTYQWTMQDADVTTASTKNASAVYTATGNHEVTLTVTLPDGKQLTRTATVSVMASKPGIAYSIDSISHVILKGNSVTFTDASRYEPTTWKWRLMSTNAILTDQGSQVTFKPAKAGAYTLNYKVANDEGKTELTEARALLVCNAESGNGLNFTTNATPKTVVTDQIGSIGKTWTLDFWMNPATFSSACNGIYALDDEGTEAFNISATGQGAAIFRMGSHSAQCTAGYFIAGEWHHYAITRNAGTICFYRDGLLFEKITEKTQDYKTWTKLQLGGSIQMNGCVDELRVWDKVLTQANIQRYAVEPLAGSLLQTALKGGLQAYYDFNQHDGIDIEDKSGRGITAHRSNFGPGGDAWTPSKGVFALDFSAPATESLTGCGTALSKTNYRVVGVSDEETRAEFSPAEHALDANSNTFWHSAYSSGETAYGHSITIDKQTNDVVNAMKLYFSRESRYRAVAAKIEQSADNQEWETLDEDHAFFDMSRPAIVFDTPCTKRFMRITFLRGATNGNLLALNSIDFYGTASQMPEMKKVTLKYESVSDEETSNENAPGRFAVDNNESTFWHSRYSSGAVAYPHSITLSTNERIDALTLMQRSTANNSTSYDAASMVVYAGDDVEHMDSIATVRLPFYVTSTIQLPTPISKKYFTLKFTRSQQGSSAWLAIREIKAFQLNDTPDGIENIQPGSAEAQDSIYDLMGHCMGTDAEALPAGIYIRGGRKFVVK